jgi:hypothetical protein
MTPHIWVRRTLDWADEEAVVAELADASMVPLWNATFNVSYQRFRHRVAEIARLSHEHVDGAVVSEWDDIPEGALVLPVDDDDWFSPDAARVLEAEADPEASGYYWESAWIELPIDLGHRLYLLRRRLFPRTPPKWLCTTNNYAMVKRADAKEALESHIRASPRFEDALARGDMSVKKIERKLSVANRNLGSRTTLLGLRKRQITRPELLRKYRRHVKLYERTLEPEIAWCRPYVAMMVDLMAELEPR